MGAIILATVHIAMAEPVAGSMGISGNAVLDANLVEYATEAASWDSMVVGTTTGTFTNVAIGSPVVLSNNWSFNSGPVSNFWSAGGFNFDLASSTVFSDSGPFPGAYFLNVILSGTVSGNGYDPTPFVGVFATADPPSDGNMSFTCRLAFSPLPPPPDLAIAASGTNSLEIVWQGYGYKLQQNCDLTTTNWVTANYASTYSLGTNYCVVTGLTNNLFFRLSQQ